MLKLKNLTVSVGDKKILKGINFEFEKGKIYAVMGPNGSGKSSLALSIMGHPNYVLGECSQILLNNENITNLSADKRANKGLFLSFQSPLFISGVKVNELLQYALQGKKDPLSLRSKIEKYKHELKITDDLLDRSLNEGASGGERKKMEVLQGAILNRNIQIYDEVDTGVDVDALKIIASFIHKNKGSKTYIIITHYNRIFRYFKPDKVIILTNGQIKKTGGYRLIEDIENNGYVK